MAAEIEAYLTAEEVSIRLGRKVTVKTLANWRCDKQGRGPPFCRFGNKIVYPESSFEAWRKNSEVRSTGDYGRKPSERAAA